VVDKETFEDLSNFLRKLIKEYSGIHYESETVPQSSDHQSWYNSGYPTCAVKEFFISTHSR
jgi:hypothetical protein